MSDSQYTASGESSDGSKRKKLKGIRREAEERLIRSGKKPDKYEKFWLCPPDYWYKINTAGFYDQISNAAAIGITIRDSNGELIQAFSEPADAVNEKEAEVEALCRAMDIAKIYSKIEFEFDAQILEDIIFYKDYPGVDPRNFSSTCSRSISKLEETLERYPPPEGGLHLFRRREREANFLACICANLANDHKQKVSFGHGGVPLPLASGAQLEEDEILLFKNRYDEDKRNGSRIKNSGDMVVRGREPLAHRLIRDQRKEKWKGWGDTDDPSPLKRSIDDH